MITSETMTLGMDTNYKFIVVSGCSYCIWNEVLSILEPHETKLWSTPFDEKFDIDDNIVFIGAGLSSSGCKWQHDSSTYVVQKLLENGVPSENIFCLVQWSEIMRETITDDSLVNGNKELEKELQFIPYLHEQRISIINKDKKTVENVNEAHLDKLDAELLPIIKSIKLSQNQWETVGNIEGTLYITPSQLDLSKSKKQNLFRWWSEGLRYDYMIPTKRLVNTYLDTIIANQNFMKNNNINYRYTFINSQFSNWYIDGSNLPKIRGGRKLVHKHINNDPIVQDKNNEFVLKLYDSIHKENDIENVYPSLRWKFSQLDLTNFYMLTNSKFRRGGLDELAMGLFNEYVFLDIDNKESQDLPAYGNHIPSLFYGNLWKEVTSNLSFLKFKDKFLDDVKKCYFEDFNSDENSIHNVTFSKKQINKKNYLTWI